MTKDEFFLIAKDGKRLFGRSWIIDNPMAMVCVIHGLGEHSGRYEHVAKYFAENGFVTFAIDLRGHGQSEGKRGHIASFDLVLDDTEELMKFAREIFNDCPMFLYGHSFGGNIVTNFTLKQNVSELKGAIISSPWLELATEPPAWQRKAAFFVSKFLPGFAQSNELDINDLTNLDEVNQAYKEDPLVHDRISTKLFTEAYKAGKWAVQNGGLIKIPALIFHGTDDPITSHEASKQFASDLNDSVTFISWDGSKHECHNDKDQGQVIETMANWVKEKI